MSVDRPWMRSSNRCQSPASSSMMRVIRGDNTSERLARMFGNSVRRKRGPCRTGTPRSSRKARIWLMMPVRWLTSRSRTRCSACRSSCSAVLVATNFIVGRCTASAIVSPSRKSFFCPFHTAGRISPASAAHHGRAIAICGSGDVRRHKLPSRSGTAACWRSPPPSKRPMRKSAEPSWPGPMGSPP